MKPSANDKFAYWFDTQMSKGSIALIKLLAIATIIAIVFITMALIATGYSTPSTWGADAFWDSFATVMNAEFPEFDDVESKHLIIKTIAAIIGLLVTSVLIGIFSNAITQRIEGLKEGKSVVIEKNHIVILGFIPGEYTLIKQVILAAGTKKRKIVIASEVPSEEMSELILENVKVPKNVKLIFRTIDIFDPNSLEKCSLATSRHILVSPMDDKKTIKTLLAVSLLINSTDNEDVRVSALVSKNEYQFPDAVAAKHNVTTIQLRNVLAKMIALSCTQTGLSDAFREVFAFNGNEFYSIEMKEVIGLSFAEISYHLDNATPVGIIHGGKVNLNPDKETKICKGDRIIVFSEEADSATFTEPNYHEVPMTKYHSTNEDRKVAIIGFNASFKTILNTMSDNITEIIVAGVPVEKKEKIQNICAAKNRTLTFIEEDIDEAENMLNLADSVNHIVLLSDYTLEDEDADIQSIFRIMRLRDIRIKHSRDFNITAEMRKQANLNLIKEEDHIDYVVASNMASLLLAQLSENYELSGLFKEILSNTGNELHLKKAKDFGCDGVYTTLQLRNLALSNNCILLGYLKAENYESFFNPRIAEEIQLNAEDSLIVLSEN